MNDIIPIEVELVPSYKTTFDEMKQRKERIGKFTIDTNLEWYKLKIALELGTPHQRLTEMTGAPLSLVQTIAHSKIDDYKKAVIKREMEEVVMRAFDIQRKADAEVMKDEKLKKEHARSAASISKDYGQKIADYYKMSRGESLSEEEKAINIYVNSHTTAELKDELRDAVKALQEVSGNEQPDASGGESAGVSGTGGSASSADEVSEPGSAGAQDGDDTPAADASEDNSGHSQLGDTGDFQESEHQDLHK